MQNNYGGTTILPYYISHFPQFYALFVCFLDFRPFRWSLQKHKIGVCHVSVISLLQVFGLGHDQGEHVKCKEGATEVLQ